MISNERLTAQIQLLSYFACEANIFDTTAFEYLVSRGNDYGIERKVVYDIYCEKALPSLVQPRDRKEKYQFLQDFMMVTMLHEDVSNQVIASIIHYAKAIGFNAHVIKRKLANHPFVYCSILQLNKMINQIYQLETYDLVQPKMAMSYWGAFQPPAIDESRFLA